MQAYSCRPMHASPFTQAHSRRPMHAVDTDQFPEGGLMRVAITQVGPPPLLPRWAE